SSPSVLRSPLPFPAWASWPLLSHKQKALAPERKGSLAARRRSRRRPSAACFARMASRCGDTILASVGGPTRPLKPLAARETPTVYGAVLVVLFWVSSLANRDVAR